MANIRRQYRYACVTLNNPTEEDETRFRLIAETADARRRHGVSYICWQMEVGENNTKHIQGYLEFTGRPRLSTIKSRFGERIHVEVRRGTQEQAIAYCQKEDTRAPGCQPMEGGVKAIQGRAGRPKNRTKNLAKDLLDGMKPSEARELYPGLHLLHQDKILKMYLELKGKRNWAMNCQIFVGKTGTGKSSTAKLQNPDAYHVPWPVGGRWWWPDYKGQECLILDEFRHQIKYDVMLKLLDRHPFIIEWKGGMSQMVSKKIIITSNIDPKDWYPGMDKAKKDPLARRINEFATIWDFEDGREYPNFHLVLREEEFEFNEQAQPEQQFNFSV